MYILFKGPHRTDVVWSNYEMCQAIAGTKKLPVGQTVERVDSRTVALKLAGKTIAFFHKTNADVMADA